tara:strand:- start:534 stop:1028 length:495 start_codon:yes stop_codon:yes gene_type:complete
MATPTLFASGVCDEYQYTLMMLAWDLDKDTHEYLREFLDTSMKRRKVSFHIKNLPYQDYDTEPLYTSEWESRGIRYNSFHLGRMNLSGRVSRTYSGPGKLRIKPKHWFSYPEKLFIIHPEKYYIDHDWTSDSSIADSIYVDPEDGINVSSLWRDGSQHYMIRRI